MAPLPSRIRLSSIRRELSLNLTLPKGHCGEALARSLGFRTQAAMLAQAGPVPHGSCEPSLEGFLDRLSSLGHVRDPGHAGVALVSALDMPIPDADGADTTLTLCRVLRRERILMTFGCDWIAPLQLGFQVIPDPSVEGFRLDRDALRFDPETLSSLTKPNAQYVLLASVLHHAAGFPARGAGRPADAWVRACHSVVDGAISRMFTRWSVKRPWDGPIAPHGMTPEAYHDDKPPASSAAPCLSFGTWRRAKTRWPATLADLLPPKPLERGREPRPALPLAGVAPSNLIHVRGTMPDLEGRAALAHADSLFATALGIPSKEDRRAAVSAIGHALIDSYSPDVFFPAIRQAMKSELADCIDGRTPFFERLTTDYRHLII